jgi:hypothetical protein
MQKLFGQKLFGKKFFTAALFGSILCAGIAQGVKTAKADVYVWGDDKTGVTLSFPDTWKIVSSAAPNDLVTFMAPSGRAHASCRMRADEEGRYLIYPPGLSWAVQKQYVSVNFWNKYIAEFDDPQLLAVGDGAGLGRGWASFAVVKYKDAVEGPYMNRVGMMFASVYNDHLYVLECSSHEDAFAQWQNMFRSVAHTVDFRKEPHELYTGNYRNFLTDKPIMLKGEGGSVYKY